jgi:membrane protein
MKRLKHFFDTLKLALKDFLDNQDGAWAAAISYYALVSVFPLLIASLVIAGFIINDPSIRQNIANSLIEAFPQANQAGVNINELVNNFIKTLNDAAPVLGVVSVVGALWSGSGIFDALMTAMNVAWDVKKDRRSFIRKVVIRFSMLFGLGLLFLLSFGASFAINIIKGLDIGIMGITPGNFNLLWDSLTFLVPFVLNFSIFAVIYWLGPDRTDMGRTRWGAIATGALLATILFETAKFLVTYFLTNLGGSAGYQRTYGAIAGLFIFLFYIYIAAMIILIGAEVAAVEHRKASIADGTLKEEEPEKAEKKVAAVAPTTRKAENEILPAFLTLALLGILWVAGRRRGNQG